MLMLIGATSPVAAYDPYGGVCSTASASSSAVCHSSNTASDPIAGPDGVIIKVTGIIALVGGAASVVIILIASLKYITSSGDSNGVSSAKHTIIYALAGLVILVLARSLIVFVVSRIK